MTEGNPQEQVTVTDKRRIDPETGEVRHVASGAAPSGAAPDAAAGKGSASDEKVAELTRKRGTLVVETYQLDLLEGCHEITEKSSKIVPLGAPFLARWNFQAIAGSTDTIPKPTRSGASRTLASAGSSAKRVDHTASTMTPAPASSRARSDKFVRRSPRGTPSAPCAWATP